MRQRVEQIDIAAGKLLLGLERDDHPVGRVDGIDDILGLAVVELPGQLLGIAGDLVHGDNLAAHEDRLREGDGAEEDVVDVECHRVFWDKGNGLGYILAIGTFYRHTGLWICHQIILVGLFGRIESHRGQMLV